jgi:hypothetical protein
VSPFHERGARDISFIEKAQDTETVGNDLQVPKAYSFTVGEANADLVLAIGDDDEFWCLNHRNIQRKTCHKHPFSGAPTIGVFCTSK